MIWIVYSLLAAFIWAFVNHLDKYLIEKYCKNTNVGALILFSCFIGIPVVLIINFFHHDSFSVGLIDIFLLVLIGVFFILGLIPTLYAMEDEETSSVVPHMLLSPVLTTILAFFFLNETLNLVQLIGIAIILIGSYGISLKKEKNEFSFHPKTLILMAISAVFISISNVLFKFMTVDVGFWTTAFWTHIGFIVTGIALVLFVKAYRNSFVAMVKVNTVGILTINILGEILTIAGNLLFNYATILGLVGIVQFFTEGAQPVFALGWGILLTLFFPKFAKENISRNDIIKKLVFMILMAFGVLLLNL